jgi:hypothetical protein
MSYKVEIIDEYSFGQWFSHHLRFETETEAEECSRHFAYAALCGILDLRVVLSDNPVNARWTKEGLRDKDGKPFYTPKPPPTPEEIQEEASRLTAAWNAIVERIGASHRMPEAKHET